jgi:hypothetical protein
MLLKICAPVTLICLLLPACSSFKATPVSAAGTPYLSLHANSYGPLSTGPILDCDPQRRQAQQRQITQNASVSDVSLAIARPLKCGMDALAKGMTKVDGNMVQYNLLDAFCNPGDTNYPAVAMLDHSPQNVVFWHQMPLVELTEVTEAAKSYCGQMKATSVEFQGAASRCPPPQATPFTQNGQPMPLLATFVISSFQCVAGAQ